MSVRSAASTAGLQSPTRPRPRPRFWLVLVFIVLVDVILEGLVGGRLIAKHGEVEVNPGSTPSPPASDGEQKSRRIVSLTIAILGAGAMRNATIAVVAIGNKTDQLGLTVAGVCALSALILVSIFNLLFQSGMLYINTSANVAAVHLHLPKSSLSLLTSIGLVFTIIEYIAYVLVVGIRIPPTGVSAARMREARRWKRGVRASEAFPHQEEHEDVFRSESLAGPDESTGLSAPTSKRHTRDSKYGAITTGDDDFDDAADTGVGVSVSPSRSHHLTSDREEQQRSLSTSYGSRQPPKSSPLAQLFPVVSHEPDVDLEAARPDVSSAQDEGEGEDLHHQKGEHVEDDDQYHNDDDDDDDNGEGNDLAEDSEAQPLTDDLDDSHDDAESNDDPNEIMDIPTASTSMTRDQSRARLALAMSHDADERKRRSRTLSQLSRRSRPSPREEDIESEAEREQQEEGDQKPLQRAPEGSVDVAFQSLEPQQQQGKQVQTSNAGAQQSKKPRFGLSFASAGSPSNTGPLSPLDTSGRGPTKPGAKNKDNKVAAKFKNVFKR